MIFVHLANNDQKLDEMGLRVKGVHQIYYRSTLTRPAICSGLMANHWRGQSLEKWLPSAIYGWQPNESSLSGKQVKSPNNEE
jgi:hypothetical protein